jgi:hypothetical protein
MASECSEFIDEIREQLGQLGLDVEIKLKRLDIMTQYGGKLYLTIKLKNDTVHNHLLLADMLYEALRLPIQVINNEYVFPMERIEIDQMRTCIDDFRHLRHSTN